MRKKMLVAMIVLCCVAGCGGGFGEGVATGAATMGAIAGVRDSLLQREADLNARYEAALNEYEVAVTSAEKLAAAAKIKSLEEQKEENLRWQTIVALAEKGNATDWTNPQAVADFTQLATMLGFGAYFARQMKKKEKT